MNFALKIIIIFIIILSVVALIITVLFKPQKEVQTQAPGVLFVSQDGGFSWSDVMDTKVKLPSLFNISKIVAFNLNIFLLTKEGTIYLSKDKGLSFEKMPIDKVIDFAIFQDDFSYIYYLTSTPQNLASIRSLNLNNNEIKELYRPISPANGLRIFALGLSEIVVFLSDGQVIKSEDKGITWRTISFLKEKILKVFYNQKFKAFFLISKNSFLRSDDGQNYQNLTEYLTNFERFKHNFTAFWAQDDILIISNNELFISKDGGYNFTRKKIVLSKSIFSINGITEVKYNNKKHIILYSRFNIYLSDNDGVSWRLIKNPSKFFISIITPDTQSFSELYLGTSK